MAHRATIAYSDIPWPHRAAPPPAVHAPALPVTVAGLRFALPQLDHAVVNVHDAQDRLTRTLLAGELAAGEHACSWDGRDDWNVPAPAGEYTLRLEVGGRLVTARRVWIRIHA